MKPSKTLRCLSFKRMDGPVICATAELTDAAWKIFLKTYCTQAGEQYYLNSLVTRSGLVNSNVVFVLTAFNNLIKDRKEWTLFKTDFVNHYWKK